MAIIGANSHTLLSFSLLIIFTRGSYSQTDELRQGQVLKDGEELASAFGNFRLGFFSPVGTTKRYLGIRYHKPRGNSSYFDEDSIQPVWVANRNTPIIDKSARLAIDGNDGNLKILHDKGNPIAVSTIQAKGNTSATLDKSGNFILHEVNSNGTIRRVVWQSFDYPTDTLLPGMKLGIDLQTGHHWFLKSWSSIDSPAEGAYTFDLDINNANQLVIRRQGEVCWRSEIPLDGHFKCSNDSYYICTYMATEKEIYFNYSVNNDVLEFPVLQVQPWGALVGADESGTGRTTFGICNFEIPDCRRDFDGYFVTKYGFMSGDGFKFKEGDNMTISECEAKCFNNCSCVAFATTNRLNNTGCEIWGRGSKFTESFTGNYSEIMMEYVPKEKKWWLSLIIALAVAVPIILSCSLCYQTRRNNKSRKIWWISLTIAVGTALLIPLLCYLCYLIWRKLKAKVEIIINRRKLLRELGDNASLSTIFGTTRTLTKGQSMKRELMIFDFQTIAVATKNFSTANRLGQGGFGPVYKGKLLDGQEIAIKRLSKSSGQGIMEFKNEAKLIAKLQHTNLVRLLGCSLQGEERLLVYEYMPNKSLDYFIFYSERKQLLDWKKRFNIIEGIVQGLIYLHKYSRLRVIHRDLKASNILLDDHMNPKISDFGMAKTFAINEPEANTNRIVGTHGYMSPEYIMNGIVSMKSDVYSFGVLVLEIISSKKNNSSYDTERPLNLVGYAWQLWKEGKGLELIDPCMGESCSPNEVLRCIHVGLLCVQDRATDRPTMSDVVSMLTNDTMALPTPKQPAFFINIAPDQEPQVTEIKPEVCSVNDVTISGIEAR